MIRRHLLSLAYERRGAASIEFALLSVMFFFVMTAALDLGMWYQQRLRLDSAVEQGGMIAFNTRSSVDASAIATYVGAAAKLAAGPMVTITCNGGTCVNTGRVCACINGSGPTYITAACNASCADGSLAGYYMKINAVATAKPIIVPAAMLGGNMVQTRSAVVRLE